MLPATVTSSSSIRLEQARTGLAIGATDGCFPFAARRGKAHVLAPERWDAESPVGHGAIGSGVGGRARRGRQVLANARVDASNGVVRRDHLANGSARRVWWDRACGPGRSSSARRPGRLLERGVLATSAMTQPLGAFCSMTQRMLSPGFQPYGSSASGSAEITARYTSRSVPSRSTSLKALTRSGASDPNHARSTASGVAAAEAADGSATAGIASSPPLSPPSSTSWLARSRAVRPGTTPTAAGQHQAPISIKPSTPTVATTARRPNPTSVVLSARRALARRGPPRFLDDEQRGKPEDRRHGERRQHESQGREREAGPRSHGHAQACADEVRAAPVQPAEWKEVRTGERAEEPRHH